MSGLHWYKKVYKFLSTHNCYVVITQDVKQKLSLIDIINSHKGEGIRLKAEYKKYGFYISQCKRGNAAIVTKTIIDEFCKANVIDKQTSSKYIFPYSAQDFYDGRRVKNICVHRNKKMPKYIPYETQLEKEEWQKYRKIVLSNRGAKCEMCGATTYLQIHHPKYIKGRKAWEYPINDVAVLCRTCHKKVHNIK